MADLLKVLTLSLGLASAGLCHAGFANLAPPPGWAQAAAGATERGIYRAAANEAWSAATVRTTASLAVGGEAVTVPAAMRMAANAGRFVGTFAWTNPLLFAAGAVGLTLTYKWLNDHNFFYDGTNNRWMLKTQGTVCTSNCLEFMHKIKKLDGTYIDGTWDKSNLAGAGRYMDSYIAWLNTLGNGSWSGKNLQCNPASPYNCYFEAWADGVNQGNQPTTPSTRSIPPYDTSSLTPTSQSAMENSLSTVPVTDGAANELNVIPAFKGLPVGDPIIAPDADLKPGVLSVPVGAPQPVPNTSPQQYSQPRLKVVPAPTADKPWQVDLQPVDVKSTDPNDPALSNAQVVQPSTTTGTQTATTTPKTTESDLCALHPEILSCAKLGDAPGADPIAQTTVSLDMTPQGGWDLAPASCPAPRSATILGHSYQFSLTQFCDFATGVKPLLVGMAYLSAALIFFGMARRNS